MTTANQIKTRERVRLHGEVFTSEREVSAMLDLVSQEASRIESRFLEPACGSGNFLVEALKRKLKVVTSRYKRSQIEWERYALIAVSSLYGIDIQADNIDDCRINLLDIFATEYNGLFKKNAKSEYIKVIEYLISKNMLVGDALTMKLVKENDYITFPEWSLVKGNKIKRRDFKYEELVDTPDRGQLKIFSSIEEHDGGIVVLPIPVKEYPLINFMKVADLEES